MNLSPYDETVCLLLGLIVGVVIARTLLRDYIAALRETIHSLVEQCDDLTDECERLNDELNANVVPIQQSKQRHPSAR